MPSKNSKQNLDPQEKQIREDFKRTFNSPHGKRVYTHLLERCHVFNTTFTGNSRTYFLEGERNVGLYLMAMMNLANDRGIEIIKEMNDE